MPLSLDHHLRSFFSWHVTQVVRYPWTYILVPVLATVIFSPFYLLSDGVTDPIQLIAPFSSRSSDEYHLFSHRFPTSGCSLVSQTGKQFFGQIIVTSNDQNVINSEDIMMDILLLDETVRNNISVEYQNNTWKYNDLASCSIKEDNFPNSAIFLAKNYQIFRNGNFKVKYPFQIIDNKVLLWPSSFGEIQCNSENIIQQAEAILLTYSLRKGSENIEKISEEWENEFLKIIGEIKLESSDVDIMTGVTFKQELTENQMLTFQIMPLTISILLVFSIWACWDGDEVSNKVLAGPFCLLSSLMASGLSLGIYSLATREVAPSLLSVPYLILGIGLDDTFVILAVWKQTKGENLEERLKKTFDECASSITITSSTNIMSFFSGFFTPCFFIATFGIYAALGFIVLYIFQITFFLGGFVLMVRREIQGRHYLTGRLVDEA
ncbi:PTCHD3, partial [Cordylochernes scorpioides]